MSQRIELNRSERHLVHLLLRKLAQEYELQILPFAPGRSACKKLLVIPRGATPYFLKLGPAKEIHLENRGYKLLRPFLPHGSYPEIIRGPGKVKNVAGLLSKLVTTLRSSQPETFGDFLLGDSNLARVRRRIRRLFDELEYCHFGEKNRAEKMQDPNRLASLLATKWRLRFRRSFKADERFQDGLLARSKRQLVRYKSIVGRLNVRTFPCGLVHGDLHLGNIILVHGQPVLTDFSMAGRDCVFRDHARFEAALCLQVVHRMGVRQTLKVISDFLEKALPRGDTLPKDVRSVLAARKLQVAIAEVRRNAYNKIRGGKSRHLQYLIHLFYHCFSYVSYPVAKRTKRLALAISGRILQTLEAGMSRNSST